MKEYERNTFLSVHPRGTFAELKSFITASQLRFKEGKTAETMLWKKSRGRKIHKNNLVHDLLYATVSRDVKRVGELIECGINPCTIMEDGTSAIHKAAVMEPPYGPNIIHRMLSYGADPNVTTPTGLSPLHIAAMWGRVHTINVLLDFGADVLHKDNDDMSALDYADEAEENREECIDALTRYRQTPRRKSNTNSGYFVSKSRYNLQKIVGSDPSSSDKDSSFKICETTEERHDIFIEQQKAFIAQEQAIIAQQQQSIIALSQQHHTHTQTTQTQTSRTKSKRKSLQKRLSFIRFPSLNDVIKKDKGKDKKDKKDKKTSSKEKKLLEKENKRDSGMFATYAEILDIDMPDGVSSNRTEFHSCEDDERPSVLTSTFNDVDIDPSMFESAFESALSIQPDIKDDSSGHGSSISSSPSHSSSSSSSSSSEDTSSSGNSSSSSRSDTDDKAKSNQIITTKSPKISKKDKKKNKQQKAKKMTKHKGKHTKEVGKGSSSNSSPIVHTSNKQVNNIQLPAPTTTTPNDMSALTSKLANIDLFKNFMAPSDNETKMLIPITLPSGNTKNCNVNINICITNSDQESTCNSDKDSKRNMLKIKRKEDPYDEKPREICEEIIPSPIQVETVDAKRLDDFIEKMSGSSSSSGDESIGEGFVSLNAQDLTTDGDILGEATIEVVTDDPLNEPTIDYITDNTAIKRLSSGFIFPASYIERSNSMKKNQEDTNSKDNKNSATSYTTDTVTTTYTPDRLLSNVPLEEFSTPIGELSTCLFREADVKNNTRRDSSNKNPESGIETGDNSSAASVEDESTLKEISESLIRTVIEMDYNAEPEEQPIDESVLEEVRKEAFIEEVCNEFKIDELCRDYESNKVRKNENDSNNVRKNEYESNKEIRNKRLRRSVTEGIISNDISENDCNMQSKTSLTSETYENVITTPPPGHYEEVNVRPQVSHYEEVIVSPRGAGPPNLKKSVCTSADSTSSQRKSIDDFVPKFVREDSFVLHSPTKPIYSRSKSNMDIAENENLFSITDMKKLIASQLSLGGGSSDKLLYDSKTPTPTYENAQTYLNNNQKGFRNFTSSSDRSNSNSSRENSKPSSETNIPALQDTKPIASEPIDLTHFSANDSFEHINDTEKLYSLFGYSTLPCRNKSENAAAAAKKTENSTAGPTTTDSDIRSNDSNDEILGSGCYNKNIIVNNGKPEQRRNVRKSSIPVLVQKAAKLASAQRKGEALPPLPKSCMKSSPHRVRINETAEYFESSEYYDDSSSEERMSSYENSDGELLSFEELEDRLGCTTDEVDGFRGISEVTINYNAREKQRSLMEELSDVSVEYGWKDICQNDIVREIDHRNSIPSRILTLHDKDLISRLTKVGIAANYVTDRTRRIYQKHLVKLESSENIVLKPSERYEDYTLEMANVLCGMTDISMDRGDLLERDMALQFENPEKHTWREGSKPTAFNYLLLDPRVTNDLPRRATKMSFLQAFKVFVASIYFVGRGRHCRPNEHLEEATKYVFRPPTNKIKMIHDIWASGQGVISIPVFTNIIPVEAFTREACIIEALGRSRLTNVKDGEFYGTAGSWKTKKQRILGTYLLMKAMKEYLDDGEKQIRIRDIER